MTQKQRDYRLNVRLTGAEKEYLYFLKRLHGKSITRLIRDWLVFQGGPMSTTAGMGGENIAKGYRPLPANMEDLLKVIQGIFDEHKGKVVDLVIRVGQPIVYSYLSDTPEGDGNIAPYDVLSHGEIKEYIPPNGEKDPRIILMNMFQKMTGAGYYPICFITGSMDVWDWMKIPSQDDREFLYGCKVYVDGSFKESTLILAGSKNLLAGVGGLSYGLVYKW
jgi:hypothetical protein